MIYLHHLISNESKNKQYNNINNVNTTVNGKDVFLTSGGNENLNRYNYDNSYQNYSNIHNQTETPETDPNMSPNQMNIKEQNTYENFIN